MPARQANEHGMTLIEVLVALLVIAIALAAAIRSVNAGISNTDYLKQRSIAQWVAMNHANEVQLLPATAKTHGQFKTEMAGQTWQINSKASATADSAIQRVEISVSSDSDTELTLSRLIVYVGVP